MIDCAKIADLVLLVIDGSFGFEMVLLLFLFARFPFALTIGFR
jgi:hypothetical protein